MHSTFRYVWNIVNWKNQKGTGVLNMAAWQKDGGFSHNEETDALAECPRLFWLLEGRAVITAAIRWLTIIMFCWNWIYWSMNHSAQVLPNCSNTADGKDSRGVFHGGHRMNMHMCECASMGTPAHSNDTCTLQKASSAAFSPVMMWPCQGRFTDFTVVSPGLPPTIHIMSNLPFGYLAPWGSLCLSLAPSGCCLGPQSHCLADFMHALPAQNVPCSAGTFGMP